MAATALSPRRLNRALLGRQRRNISSVDAIASLGGMLIDGFVASDQALSARSMPLSDSVVACEAGNR